MDRILEPEIMDDYEQSKAYAEANFEEPHNKFVALFKETFPNYDIAGYVLDLGCGACDVTFRFAKAFPNCFIHGVDGSEAMLRCSYDVLKPDNNIRRRIKLFRGMIPGVMLPKNIYDVILSNSLLHHLVDPFVLWDTIRRYAGPGTIIFIVDLIRPRDKEEARILVNKYTGNEPEILKRDFYNSLLASFEPDEIREQLKDVGLNNFVVKEISDRHVLVYGTIDNSL